jgi:hypothetical protein
MVNSHSELVFLLSQRSEPWTFKRKEPSVRALSSAKEFGVSFYLFRLFLFDAFRGLSFLVSTVPLFLLT